MKEIVAGVDIGGTIQYGLVDRTGNVMRKAASEQPIILRSVTLSTALVSAVSKLMSSGSINFWASASGLRMLVSQGTGAGA